MIINNKNKNNFFQKMIIIHLNI